MKIFGRDPALIIAAVIGVLNVLVTFQLDWLSAGHAAAIGGLVYAGVTAWVTRPWAPAVFTGLVHAAAGVYGEYFTPLPDTTVALYSNALLAVLALLTREQVKPVPSAVTRG